MDKNDRETVEELCALVHGDLDPKAFPHPEHVRFAYEMLGRHSFAETVWLFSSGLRKLAAKSGRPDLYHDTITVAFLALVGERRAISPETDWPRFIAANRDLLDKNCLGRWYDRARLSSDLARKNFILPAEPRLERMAQESFGRAASNVSMHIALYTGLIIAASAITIWTSWRGETGMVALASVEILGAVLFLVKRLRTVGLGLLLIVFSVATSMELLSGTLPIRFLLYGTYALLLWRLTGLLQDRCRGQ
jgi:hypothetical protein